jgi:hypothetical protein
MLGRYNNRFINSSAGEMAYTLQAWNKKLCAAKTNSLTGGFASLITIIIYFWVFLNERDN